MSIACQLIKQSLKNPISRVIVIMHARHID